MVFQNIGLSYVLLLLADTWQHFLVHSWAAFGLRDEVTETLYEDVHL